MQSQKDVFTWISSFLPILWFNDCNGQDSIFTGDISNGMKVKIILLLFVAFSYLRKQKKKQNYFHVLPSIFCYLLEKEAILTKGYT